MIVTTKEQQLIFDFEFGCPNMETDSFREGAQDLLRRIVPIDLLDEDAGPLDRARFQDSLPLIAWSDLSKAPCTFSALMLCKQRLNASNFFYDMISRWLLPSKRSNVELFFSSDIRIPHLTEELLSVAEIVIHLKSAQDVEEVKRNIEIIEKELRLGLVSNYHARRILEFKGLSNDGKTAMIQEKISSLIQSHSQDFDRGIFTQMQQFLVNCQEDFKNERDYHHISRIISNLYSLKKLLKQKIRMFPAQRHIHLKFLKTQLPGQRRFLSPFDTRGVSKEESPVEGKHVLGVLLGINFLREHEVFEMMHLVSAIQKHLPYVQPVKGSFFLDRISDPSMQTLYLEVKKPEGTEFTLEEVQRLRISLPEQIKGNIEQLAHPIFMPRNEEEILRNIMLLSRQLRFAKDLPQVVISFDEQKGEDLYFTVVLLRVQLAGASDLQEIFAKSSTPLKYIHDRVRRVGHVRKKYVKEASVFRTFVKNASFLREDRSVDMYKARHAVFEELSNLIGEIRDFNGGMIYKQSELLELLKQSLGSVAKKCPVLVERFYYALDPIEARTAVDVEDLKQWFLLFLQVTKAEGNDFLYRQDAKRVIAIVPVDPFKQKLLTERISSLAVPSHQFGAFSLEVDGALYFGCLLLTEDSDLQSRFLSALD